MERDELIAFAEREGLKVDRRLGDEKLRESIEAQIAGLDDGPVSRDWDGADGEPDTRIDEDSPIANPAATEVVAEPTPEPESEPTWPKRIAPRVWLDRSGGRHTSLAAAVAATRGRS